MKNGGEKGLGKLPQNGVANSELVESYLGKRKLSKSSKEFYHKAMNSWEDFVGIPLMDIDRESLTRWFIRADADYKASTLISYQLQLRHLHTHGLMLKGLKRRDAKLRTDELFEVIPVKDLRRVAKKENEMRDKLITPREFKKILQAAKHPRVQAMLTILYDSGCRKGEILSLRIRDLEFRQDHAVIRVQGKTGERTIPLMGSLPYLKQWLMVHPSRRNLDAPLFCDARNGRLNQMSSSALNFTLSALCKKTGVRHLYPHQIRHTRLTDLAEAGLGEFGLKDFAGWTTDSKMAAKYVHLSGKSHVDKVLQIEGLEIESPTQNGVTMLIEVTNCPQCDSEIGINMTFCPGCGYILDDRLRLEKAGENEKLRQDIEALWQALESQGKLIQRLMERMG